MRVVITGANRGIGLELVRQLTARGDRVEATVRDPDGARELRALDNVRIHRVDVTDNASIDQLASTLGDAAIDVVINCAGVYGSPQQTLLGVDFTAALHTFDVNVLGALRVSLALLPHLRRGRGKKLAHISSGILGSIAQNTNGSHYSYRTSKSALNMMSRSLAADLRKDGIASYVISPGWVRTDMGGPEAPTLVDDSVRGILRVLDTATLDDSGEFLDFQGGRCAW